MATAQRQPHTALIERLVAEPFAFEFTQAVRLLELHAAHLGDRLSPVAEGSTAEQEVVHFSLSNNLGFAATEVTRLQPDPERPGAWIMQTQLMGLAGSAGVLPYHYSELLQRRSRLKDHTLRHFLELFNQRSVALYYKAWRKYRLAHTFEQKKLREPSRPDAITQALASLIGFGSERLQQTAPVPLEQLIHHGGLLARLVKSAASLESVLREALGLPVEIAQFRGQWYDIPDDLQTRLPGANDAGMNCQLGVNSICGQRCWQVQSRFRVRIRDLDYKTLMTLRPGSQRMRLLQTLIDLAAGPEQDFDTTLELPRHQLPRLRLDSTPERQPLLGWNTLLGEAPPENREQNVEVIVSQAFKDAPAGAP